MEKFGRLLASVEITEPSIISIQKIRDSLLKYDLGNTSADHFNFEGAPKFSFFWWYFNVLDETYDFGAKKFINLFKINGVRRTTVKDCRDFLKQNDLECGGLPPLFSLFEKENQKEITSVADGWIVSPTDKVCYGDKYSVVSDMMKRHIDPDEIPPYNAPHSTAEEVIAGLDLEGPFDSPTFNIGFLNPTL